MHSCIIIDDESKARILLKAMLERYAPELEVIADCQDLPSGVKAIRKLKPDLIFLDIEMPEYSGLELLDFFEENELQFDVIFTTAYNEYALQAFRFSAIDYLLKPLQPQQLQDAIDRFKKKSIRESARRLELLKTNMSTEDNLQERRIVIPIGQSLKFLRLKDIILIKGEGAYSEIYLKDGEKLLISKNLKHFEELLMDVNRFIRTHKSYIINLDEVIEYNKSSGGLIMMNGGLSAGISSEKLDEFLKSMQSN
jgi:two-component system LytT family response regulator